MKRVLYAEDEYTNQRLVQIRFKKNGIDCDIVGDGQEAWKLFQEREYDLVLLDQHMPSIPGSQLAKMIRKKNKTIPIIGITSDDSRAEKMYSSGVNEVFIKPLEKTSYEKILLYL